MNRAEALEKYAYDRDLRGANLSRANLFGADLYGANLSRANLSDADLRGANLSRANLSDADLRGANLRGANLSDADLRGANLGGANLGGANLSDADLRGANLSRAEGIIAIYIPDMSSRGDYLYAVRHEANIMIKAGCFWDTIDKFVLKVQREKGADSLYENAAKLIMKAWRHDQ